VATRRLLVVTTAPLEGDFVREQVRQHAGGGDAEVRVVAPASKISPLRWIFSDEDEARAEAEQIAVEAAEQVEEVPAVQGEVEVEVGDTDPVLAIQDALATFPADEVIIVTASGADATWIEKDTFQEALQRFNVPVSHLTVDGG
jgi:nucleotide-binding universal stress UspA family protein